MQKERKAALPRLSKICSGAHTTLQIGTEGSTVTRRTEIEDPDLGYGSQDY